MAIQAGAHSLEKAQGGNGTLLGGVPAVAPAKVVVLGGGVVGVNSARMALGLGADVTILIAPCRDCGSWTACTARPQDPLLHPYQYRGVHRPGRFGDRCRADPGGGGAQAADPRHAQADAQGLGAGG
ncbi:hypothetical protein ACTG15_12425 [Aeromonas sp. 164P]